LAAVLLAYLVAFGEHVLVEAGLFQINLGQVGTGLGSAKGSPPPLAFKTVLATLAAHGSSVNGLLS